MVNDKRIEFILAPDGTVKVEAFGYEGESCERATKPFEEALGFIESSTEYKPERFVHTTEGEKESQW